MSFTSNPRPTTVSVFAQKSAPKVSGWLQEAIKSLPLEAVKKITNDFDAKDPTATMEAMLRAAAQQCLNEHNNRLDAYFIGKNFEEALEWPVDADLIAILNEQIHLCISFAVNQATREWVLRSGIRFAGKKDETVHFIQEDGVTRAGTVIEVLKGMACARVQVHVTGREVKVFAEELETG